MKQSMAFFLASILLLLSACQYKEQTNTPIVESGKQSNSSASTETKGTKTEKNMIETGSDTLAFASEILTDDALYTFDFGVKSRFNTPFYPCGMNDHYSSTVSLCQKSTSFPDTLDSFDEKIDIIEKSSIFIGSLNMYLEIPEGYYVYCIPGQYWDSSSKKAVTLEFVREYVFTMMDVEEEKLLEDIRGFFDTDHFLNDLNHRGPGYVLYSFRVFRKEYLPIENLFTSLLADTGEYFVSGEYYISMGRSAWTSGNNIYYSPGNYDPMAIDSSWQEKTTEELLNERFYIPYGEFPLTHWIQTLLESSERPVFTTESTVDRSYYPITDEPGPFFYGARSMFKNGSSAYYTRPNDRFLSASLQVANANTSVVSEKWWNDYQEALSMLAVMPDNNRYLNRISISFESMGWKEGQPTYVRELMDGWFYNPGKTKKLQAYVYANLAAFRTIDLYSIVILVRNIEGGGRLYIALLDEHPENDAPHELTLVEWSWDALQEGGLDFAREYAEKWL